MTTPQGDEPFAGRFLDDYFAECDEHLGEIRAILLSLEPRIGSPIDRALLDDLMRRFHSLKGISGMVQFREAEMLAHHLESYLRLLQANGVLSSDGIQALIDGVSLFEQLVGAFRVRAPLPDTALLLARLQRLLAVQAATPRAPADRREPEPAAGVWIASFTPSADRQARNVSVSTVRQRLGGVGRVVDVTPKVSPGGGVRFDFVLEGDIDGAAIDGWAEDGITFSRAADMAGEQEPAVSRQPLPASNITVPAAAHYIRVDLARVDELMRLVAEVVVTRARLQDALSRAEAVVPAARFRAVQEQMTALERDIRELRDGVMRIRLVPIGEVLQRMPFVVRDLAREAGRQIRLEINGQDAVIDKFLTERVLDPIVHLVRNAITHGIEAPEERVAAGKPAEGRILLSAANVGDTITIAVSDDGRGMDRADIVARARAAGLDVDDEADEAALLKVLCAAGFSTREAADRAAGRGIGMSVVKTAADALGGALSVDTAAGAGTTFVLTLPLSVAIIDALLVSVGSHLFAVPQSAVQELVEVDPATIVHFERNEMMRHRGGVLPLVRLSELFEIDGAARSAYHAIVLGTGTEGVGVVVDRVVGHREIVVRTLSDPLVRVEGVSGATELGDGRAVLILDVVGLLARVRTRADGDAAVRH